MFTPPPSPLPPVSLSKSSPAPESLLKSDEKRALAEAYGDVDLESPPASKSLSHSRSDSFEAAQEAFLSSQAAKQRAGRRLKMVALFFPLVLVGLTFATHMCNHTLKSSPVVPAVLPESTTPFAAASSVPELWKRQAATNTSGGIGAAPTRIPPSEQPLPTIPLDSNPPVLPLPFLQAYDGVLPSGFVTQTCLTFVNEMIGTTDFRRCRPFSFLAQTSSQFQNVSHFLCLLWFTAKPTLSLGRHQPDPA